MLKGKGALSDAELIAILIGSGAKWIGGRFK
jgi:DNA repair protein RadC